MQLIKSLLQKKDLIFQFSIREITDKYKGSYFGLLWLFITPFVMLTVYTFVFSVIFKAKWSIAQEQSGIQFALILFCGLIIFNLFSECVTRSPSIINAHANYVKKINFPLEILPIAILMSALFHFIVNFIILLGAVFYFHPYSIMAYFSFAINHDAVMCVHIGCILDFSFIRCFYKRYVLQYNDRCSTLIFSDTNFLSDVSCT